MRLLFLAHLIGTSSAVDCGYDAVGQAMTRAWNKCPITEVKEWKMNRHMEAQQIMELMLKESQVHRGEMTIGDLIAWVKEQNAKYAVGQFRSCRSWPGYLAAEQCDGASKDGYYDVIGEAMTKGVEKCPIAEITKTSMDDATVKELKKKSEMVRCGEMTIADFTAWAKAKNGDAPFQLCRTWFTLGSYAERLPASQTPTYQCAGRSVAVSGLTSVLRRPRAVILASLVINFFTVV